MDEKNIFSVRMKEARQKVDISQAELSRRTGIAPATLSSYEVTENPKNPTLDKVILIAKALNVSIDWLCGLENEVKDNENIGFDEIMKAIILLSGLKKSSFSYCDGAMNCLESFDINFYDSVIVNFCIEYQKIKEFIENEDYPQYLKDGLLQALINKFSNYIVANGEIVDIDYHEMMNDGSEPPF